MWSIFSRLAYKFGSFFNPQFSIRDNNFLSIKFQIWLIFSRKCLLAAEETAVVDLAASAATVAEGKSLSSPLVFRFSMRFLG